MATEKGQRNMYEQEEKRLVGKLRDQEQMTDKIRMSYLSVSFTMKYLQPGAGR